MVILDNKIIKGENSSLENSKLSSSLFAEEIIKQYNDSLVLFRVGRNVEFNNNLLKILREYEDKIPKRDNLLEIIRCTILQGIIFLIRKEKENLDIRADLLLGLMNIFFYQDYYSNDLVDLFKNDDHLVIVSPVELSNNAFFFEIPVVQSTMEALMSVSRHINKQSIYIEPGVKLVDEYRTYKRKKMNRSN